MPSASIHRNAARQSAVELETSVFLDMSSLTISVGGATLGTRCSVNISPHKCITTKQVSKFSYTHTPKIPFSRQELELKENPASFGRREAIGGGFLFGLANVLQQPLPAVAAEATPCEFTTAPSGLAFCDKVVGTGPEAEKGQLIKVCLQSILPFNPYRRFKDLKYLTNLIECEECMHI